MRFKTILLYSSVLALFGWMMMYGYRVHIQSTVALPVEHTTLLIDAGHGGADNGASAADGTAEDGINLSISLQLRDLLLFFGYPVEMTRIEDCAVETSDDDPARGWKVNDMYNRLKMYDAAAFTISIHQNHFSQTKYHGAQVFYGTGSEKSKELAAILQTRVAALLQPDNKRAIKPAGESIFLLHRTQRPAVIVECGFLSNVAETENLKNIRYQQQMAFAIGCGILQYTA